MHATERDDRNAHERRLMIEEQLQKRGIHDPRVLEAMRALPRHRFVPEAAHHAYEDRALSIAAGQTISQPYMVARACELAALQPHERVLDVGAGSGYQAAVLSRLCARVVAIELRPELAERARAVLAQLELDNVHVVCGDGTHGYPPEAPYDAIVVAAGGPEAPAALIEQLAPNGRLVMPLGPSELQTLSVLRKGPHGLITREPYDPCRYVPLRGSGGWADEEPLPDDA